MPVNIRPINRDPMAGIPRPDGFNPVVVLTHGPTGAREPRLFEVIRESDLDDMVLIAPLARDDDRPPFWIGAGQVREVLGAYVNRDGYLCIPTREVEA